MSEVPAYFRSVQYCQIGRPFIHFFCPYQWISRVTDGCEIIENLSADKGGYIILLASNNLEIVARFSRYYITVITCQKLTHFAFT